VLPMYKGCHGSDVAASSRLGLTKCEVPTVWPTAKIALQQTKALHAEAIYS